MFFLFYDQYEILCKKANKKPYTVAKEIGLGSSNVAQWKKGSTPRPDVLQKLSDYFGVSQAVLLGLDVDKKENPTANGEVDFTDMELLSAFNSADESTKQAIRLILGLK